jgi:hypothetical protein
LNWRLGGIRSHYERCEEEKNVLNLVGFEHVIFQLFPLTENWLLCPSFPWLLMNNDMDRKCKEAILYNLKNSSIICLDGVRKPRGTAIRKCVDILRFELDNSWLRS